MIKQAINILDRVFDPVYVGYLERLKQVKENTVIKKQIIYLVDDNVDIHLPKYKYVDEELVRAKKDNDHDQMILLSYIKTLADSRYVNALDASIVELDKRLKQCRKKKDGKCINDLMTDKHNQQGERPPLCYISEMPRIVTRNRALSPDVAGVVRRLRENVTKVVKEKKVKAVKAVKEKKVKAVKSPSSTESVKSVKAVKAVKEKKVKAVKSPSSTESVKSVKSVKRSVKIKESAIASMLLMFPFNKFPFKTKDQCNSRETSQKYYLSKDDVLKVIDSDEELKDLFPAGYKSLKKQDICNLLFNIRK
jgi:hypothetical protein